MKQMPWVSHYCPKHGPVMKWWFRPACMALSIVMVAIILGIKYLIKGHI